MSPIRIVPPDIAHMASAAQPCRDEQRFPGDEVAAGCRFQLGDHPEVNYHEDVTRTRRWSLEKRNGEAVTGMMRPGSAPLRRSEAAS